ncbi:MAG TPA: hypothetical protein DDW52_11320 [Planctomycetaceae bacterium]|nr:hypothetical protein [Planctomycetaceae bacterium]
MNPPLLLHACKSPKMPKLDSLQSFETNASAAVTTLTAGKPSRNSVPQAGIAEIELDDPGLEVERADGTQCNIEGWSYHALEQFQCEQEPLFARAIERTRKGSVERADVIRRAYTSICTVLEQMARLESEETQENHSAGFSMGMDHRYTDLILELLQEQEASSVPGGLFEVGFSSGVLLSEIANAGYVVGGLEVVQELLDQAKTKLAAEHHDRLLLGDLCKTDLSNHVGRYSVVYWNDVFEHIPVDEISDYLSVIYSLLAPGGKLVTITPNWHMRPSDVTDVFKPPRSEAVGFHLKEYTAGEVCRLVGKAGFRRVETPIFISRSRIYQSRVPVLTRLKNLLEPLLEVMPYAIAVQMCRRFGLNCTIATK